jgi:uncharacterized protein YfaS (alpha-2-macroglobulin family)
VDLSRRIQVELFNSKDNKVVCTEGPYTLNDKQITKSVNINCGNDTARWVLLAVAGAGAAAAVTSGSGGGAVAAPAPTASAVAFGVQSNSK